MLRWIRNKELKAYRLGKTYRVTKEEYQEFLDQRYTGKSDEDQRNYLLLSQLDRVEYGIPAPISDTANRVRPGPESTAPKRFLHLREGLNYFAGGCSFYLVRNLGRGNRWRSRKKEMDMVWLDVYRANRPVPCFADPTDFLLNERCQLAHQNLLPVLGAPDKVIGQLIGDVFGVLRIHTTDCNRCSRFSEEPARAALPPDESWGYPEALS